MRVSEAMAEVSVVVVGDSQCGKTQLINRFAHSTFSQVTLSKQTHHSTLRTQNSALSIQHCTALSNKTTSLEFKSSKLRTT